MSGHKARAWAMALCVATWAIAPSAHAKRADGLALGGEVGATVSGLSIQHGLGIVRLQLVAGVDALVADGADDTVRAGVTLRGLVPVFQAPWSNLLLGLGWSVAFGTDDPLVVADLTLRVEHFFDDFVAASGSVYLPVALSQTATNGVDTGRSIALMSVGFGGGFHFHF